MRPHEGGAAPASTGTTPVTQPRANFPEGSRLLYCQPLTPEPQHTRRWKRRPRFDIWDVIAWALFTALAVGTILACCAVIWVAS